MGAIPDNSHSSFSFVVSAFLSCLHYRAAQQFPPSTFSLILLLHRFPPITPVVTRCLIFSLLITRPKKRVCLVLILLIRYPIDCTLFEGIIYHFCRYQMFNFLSAHHKAKKTCLSCSYFIDKISY